MKHPLIAFTTLIALMTVPASAQLIVGVTYNTGYDGNLKLAAGQTDPNFVIVSSPGDAYNGAAVVPSPIPAVWGSEPHAQFISPTENQAMAPAVGGDAPGVYDFQTSVTTDFSVPTELQISGTYMADNYAVVEVDGSAIFTPNPGTPDAPDTYYGIPLSFSYDLSVSAGTQVTTLDFLLTNYTVNNTTGTSPGDVNPAGLLVSCLKVTAAPEPSTWAMMVVGLGAVLLLPRLRRVS